MSARAKSAPPPRGPRRSRGADPRWTPSLRAGPQGDPLRAGLIVDAVDVVDAFDGDAGVARPARPGPFSLGRRERRLGDVLDRALDAAELRHELLHDVLGRHVALAHRRVQA